MIYDLFENAHHYEALGQHFQAAFRYLSTASLHDLPAGKQIIDGDRLFALVNDYTTQPLQVCRFESHRRYADIQLMIRGQERIGVALLPTPDLIVTEDYSSVPDVVFYSGSGDLLTLTPGRFTIFFPHDAHQPGIEMAAPELCRKVVVKVELST